MPEKQKKNFVQIRSQYDAVIAFSEGKIDKEDYESKHAHGGREKWVEMPFVASSRFLLESFLLLLPVPQRLRAVKDTYDYSFEDIKKIGGFGGSIHSFFSSDDKSKHIQNRGQKNKNEYEDPIDFNADYYELNLQRARLSIILDIPLTYLIKDKPSVRDTKQFEGLEFKMVGKRISFKNLERLISRPTSPIINAYRIENKIGNEVLFHNLESEYINLRLDLQKSFFSIEFYLTSRLDVNLATINRIAEYFNSNIHAIILSRPLLSNSFKLSVVGTYIEKQSLKAQIYTEFLTNILNGEILFPYQLEFEHIGESLPQYRD